MGRLSISQRLRKASKPELKQKIAVDWSAEWQTEYETHVRNFEKAIRDKDFDLLVRTLGWLKADGKRDLTHFHASCLLLQKNIKLN